jgi:hypothetical protein
MTLAKSIKKGRHGFSFKFLNNHIKLNHLTFHLIQSIQLLQQLHQPNESHFFLV